MRWTLLIVLVLGYTGGVMALQITSSVFKNGEMIPSKYTCDGANSSPPLQWHDAPSGTQSFALIVDDPDAPAGTWDHWLLFNIPPQVTAIAEDEKVFGSEPGKNSWGHTNYGGPCPPQGIHRYYFKLYALDTKLSLPSSSTKATIEDAMKNHILAKAELLGKYERHK